ncbi:MAG: 1-aminocyclopropane-1-carboxylate deaminase/D-cysteine desulfhydrase [Myxococcota bacterium]
MELGLSSPLSVLCASDCKAELWLKNDGLVHPSYGGNKARKAALLLAEAERRRAQRILTFGAAGSHHVLATTLFARERGLQTAALLTRQPSSAHARRVLRRSLAAGLEARAASSLLSLAWQLWRERRAEDYVVPPGGSNLLGAAAYAAAIAELEQQLEAQHIAPPDWIVVPLGSGGTAAGLLAGLGCSRLPTRLLAVQVVNNPLARIWVTKLAADVLRSRARTPSDPRWSTRLVLDASQLGRGYGYSTSAGIAASAEAASLGLTLDPTYTAKAFAAALELARGQHSRDSSPQRVLYWHTLSAVPEPSEAPLPELPRNLERLFVETDQKPA